MFHGFDGFFISIILFLFCREFGVFHVQELTAEQTNTFRTTSNSIFYIHNTANICKQFHSSAVCSCSRQIVHAFKFCFHGFVFCCFFAIYFFGFFIGIYDDFFAYRIQNDIVFICHIFAEIRYTYKSRNFHASCHNGNMAGNAASFCNEAFDIAEIHVGCIRGCQIFRNNNHIFIDAFERIALDSFQTAHDTFANVFDVSSSFSEILVIQTFKHSHDFRNGFFESKLCIFIFAVDLQFHRIMEHGIFRNIQMCRENIGIFCQNPQVFHCIFHCFLKFQPFHFSFGIFNASAVSCQIFLNSHKGFPHDNAFGCRFCHSICLHHFAHSPSPFFFS